jgi:type II secretory pathway pseudopilin PulG
MSKMKGHSTNASGFTLIETAIAMVVMMVVGLGATSLFFYAVRSNSGSEGRSQALAIAQQRLEDLRTVAFNDPQLAIGQTTTTVVLQEVEAGSASATAASYGGDVQAYGSGAAGGGNMSAFSSKPGKRPNPTPTPTPTTGGGGGGTGGGGGGGGTSGSDDEYKVVLDVQGLPAGAAIPVQKRITITVTPENGYGTNSWINRNPVVIVLHRSSPATGPYRQ